jgi:hypothetical protein
MSGYLQRLVARVQLPAAGVRPVVRPLFAPPAESFGEIVAEEPASSPTPTRRPTARSEGIARAADFGSLAAASLPPLSSRESAESKEPMPHAQVRAPQTRPTERAQTASAESEPIPLVEPPPAAAHTTSFVHTVHTSRESGFRPLMPPVPVAARAQAAIAVPPAQEPLDEIQIHIGRIEVHAVPPAPAPRAVLPRPRSGVNLDQYLKRGR